MAGSLGLGIGYEEHHTQTVGILTDGWEAEVCTEGTWDPDCECCCQIFPPNTNGFPADPDWTLVWGVDAAHNVYPEDDLLLSSDGFWEVVEVGGTYAVIPVTVAYCQGVSSSVAMHSAACCS
jgi:hypothetical protein